MTALPSSTFLALLLRIALASILAMLVAPAQADETVSPRCDRLGDPLPAGASARLGTVRFRGYSRYIAFSADGKTIVGTSWSATIYFWDSGSGKLLRQIHPKTNVSVMAVSPKEARLAVGSGAVNLFDMATGKQLYELGKGHLRGAIMAVAFAPDGRSLVTGTDDATEPIMAWDVATGKYLRSFEGKPGPINSLTYSADGKHLASYGQDKNIRVWDARSGGECGQMAGHKDFRTALTFAGGGKFLTTAGKDQTIRIWDVAGRKELAPLADKHGGVNALAGSPDGRTLACGNEDGTIGLWDLGTRQELRHWQASSYAVHRLAYAPDGKTLVSDGEAECGPRLWDVATGRERSVFGGHRSAVYGLVFSADGRQLYSTAHDNLALRWDIRSGRAEDWLRATSEHTGCFLLSPDAKTAATQGIDWKDWKSTGLIHLWDTSTGKKRRTLGPVPARPVPGPRGKGIAFSPDSRLLAAGGSDREIFLWDTATGKELGHWHKLSGPTTALTFSPDGKGLAAATWAPAQPSLRYWDTTTGKDRCVFECNKRVGCIAFSPDGRLLASIGASSDEPIRLWDTTTGKQLRAFDQFEGPPFLGSNVLAFSPDSRFLAASRNHEDTPIRVWEVATGREVFRFRGPTADSLCFSPDGHTLASGGYDSAILLWDLTGRQTDDGLQPAVLSERQLTTVWQELANADAGRAYRAAWLLVSDGERTAPYLQRQWRALLAVDEKKIAHWIADLDSEQFAVREQAMTALEKQGVAVLPALRRVLQDGPSLELRRRIQQILAQLDRQVARLSRMVFALEQLGNPAARELLADIADRKLDERLSQEAKTALRRLAPPHGDKP